MNIYIKFLIIFIYIRFLLSIQEKIKNTVINFILADDGGDDDGDDDDGDDVHYLLFY